MGSQLLLKFNRDLEKIAEIGWSEIKTTFYIKKNLSHTPFVLGFGKNKVGLIYRLGKGKNKIFLRADIDALPTKNKVRHLCGHHTHTASLMAAFLYGKTIEDILEKKDKEIIFIFQPAEETFPSGAKEIIKSNFDLIKSCQAGFGLHVEPNIPLGYIYLGEKITNAAGDYFEVEIKGKSTHIKAINQGIDAIEGAAYLIFEIKKFQKKLKSFPKKIIFNANTIKGGTVPNRIADYVFLNGDIRYLNKKNQLKIKQFFLSLPKRIKKKYKFSGEINIKYFDGYPPLINDLKLTKMIKNYFKKKSSFKLFEKKFVSMGTEDFSFFSQVIPCVYGKIGIGPAPELHTDNFFVSQKGVVYAYHYWQSIINWFIDN